MGFKKIIRRWLMPEVDKEINLLAKVNSGLLSEVESLKEKNKRCQENINKTNSYWKGKVRSRVSSERV